MKELVCHPDHSRPSPVCCCCLLLSCMRACASGGVRRASRTGVARSRRCGESRCGACLRAFFFCCHHCSWLTHPSKHNCCCCCSPCDVVCCCCCCSACGVVYCCCCCEERRRDLTLSCDPSLLIFFGIGRFLPRSSTRTGLKKPDSWSTRLDAEEPRSTSAKSVWEPYWLTERGNDTTAVAFAVAAPSSRPSTSLQRPVLLLLLLLLLLLSPSSPLLSSSSSSYRHRSISARSLSQLTDTSGIECWGR